MAARLARRCAGSLSVRSRRHIARRARRAEVSDPTASRPRTPPKQDHGEAQDRARDAQRRTDDGLEGDAAERDPGRDLDDPDRQAQRDPARCREDSTKRRGRAGAYQGTGEQRHEAGSHGRRDEWHDHQVHRRGDECQPPERGEHDGEGRRLGCQRDAEAFAQPAGQSSTGQAIQAIRQWRRPGHEPRGGERRQLEPGVAHERRLREEQQECRETERRGGPAASAGLPGEEDHPGHRPGTEHRWRGPGEHDVRDDRDGGDDRSSPTPEPTGHRPDGGRHDRDVPARDRDDVTDAGGREVGRDLPVDAIAQADEDPRGESRLGFGEDAGQQLAGIAAPTLQQRAGIDGPLQHLHRPGVEGAPRVESLEVSTIGAVRSRPRTSRHGDPVARFDRWIARQRRGDPESARAAGHGPDRGHLMTLARGPDGLDDHRPRPAVGRRTRQGRSGRSHARPQRDRQDPDRHREEPDATAARQPQADEQQQACRAHQDAHEVAVLDADRKRSDRRPDRQPAGSGHVSEPRRARAAFRRSFRRGRRASAALRRRRTAPPPGPR